MDNNKPCKATPEATLEERVMSYSIPKTEAEWWANREITRLREELSDLREKAEKWDKVEEIARGFCNECPLKGCEQYEFVNPCEAVEDIVKALNQPEVKP